MVDFRELYRALSQRADEYGIVVGQAHLPKDEAGRFDGLSITINRGNSADQQAFYLAHSIGSIVRWATANEASRATYAELRQAKKHKDQDPNRFERALAGFSAFEEAASEHAVWLIEDLRFAEAVPNYTRFARADLDAMLEFHRTGKAPTWDEFFPRWQAEAARNPAMARPYRPSVIPPFRPVKIETQEIVQEKD